MKFAQGTNSILVFAALTMLFLSCVTDYDDPSYYSERYDKEFEYCVSFLNAHFLYRDSLPQKPFSYPSPDSLYKSTRDPDTRYLDSLDPNNFESLRAAEYERGLGIEIEALPRGALITYVYLNSPADNAGLIQGDTLITVNDSSLANLSLETMKDYIKGESNEKKILGIIKKGSPSDILDTLTITEFVIPTVYVDKIDSTIAYIYIAAFINDTSATAKRKTADEFTRAMQRIEADSISTIIIDVRSNTIGEFDQAIEIVNSFLPGATPIVILREWVSDTSAAGGHIKKETVSSTDTGSYFNQKKIYLLMNDSTAGVAELFLYGINLPGNTHILTTYGNATYGSNTMLVVAKTPLQNHIHVTNAEIRTIDDEPFQKISPDNDKYSGLKELLTKEHVAFDTATVNRIDTFRLKHKRSMDHFTTFFIKKIL